MKTSLFTLPPGAEIDAAVQRYRKALAGPQGVLESSDSDGQLLYRTLIAPARALLKKDAKVFVIPDGSLNNLNFETLLAPDSKLHYWIEDVTILSASSLRLLAVPHPSKQKHSRSLLRFGHAGSPGPDDPELPNPAMHRASVAE